MDWSVAESGKIGTWQKRRRRDFMKARRNSPAKWNEENKPRTEGPACLMAIGPPPNTIKEKYRSFFPFRVRLLISGLSGRAAPMKTKTCAARHRMGSMAAEKFYR